MGAMFLASALNRSTSLRKYSKWLVIPGEMLLFKALARNMAPMTNHRASTLRFLTEAAPLYDLFSLPLVSAVRPNYAYLCLTISAYKHLTPPISDANNDVLISPKVAALLPFYVTSSPFYTHHNFKDCV